MKLNQSAAAQQGEGKVCENLFLPSAPLNPLLAFDFCQQIHFVALRRAVRKMQQGYIPGNPDLTERKSLARLHGAGAYIPHPDETKSVFRGVTLGVYRLVENLYCSRVNRSIPTVTEIVNVTARRAGVMPLHPEAVWTLSLYLDDRREEVTTVCVERTDTTWWVGRITPEIRVRGESDALFRPSILFVLDVATATVLAFRLIEETEIAQAIPLVVYDAIVAQRVPSARTAGGLRWHLPTGLAFEGGLPECGVDACRQIGIRLSRMDCSLPVIHALRGDWWKDFSDRQYSKRQFELLFDTYLEKVHGYGPYRPQERRDCDFGDLIGYSLDPAQQFPGLRSFLPSHAGLIAEDAVEYNGLHYTDELLSYWPNRRVEIKVSEHQEALAWVYVDGEVLCEVRARELRRADGTYRANRMER